MHLSSLVFIGKPVLHLYPTLYEGLGLPEFAKRLELSFAYSCVLGKQELEGTGRLAQLVATREILITLDRIKGIGPAREGILKEKIIEEGLEKFLSRIREECVPVHHVPFPKGRRESSHPLPEFRSVSKKKKKKKKT